MCGTSASTRRSGRSTPSHTRGSLTAKRRRLCEIAVRESAAFVYDEESLDAAIAQVKRVESVDRWAYAMKANWHPQILRRMHAAGLMLECVSRGELDHAFASVPGLSPQRVLFTPNFAPRGEYEYGLELGVHVTLDNLYPLKMWPELLPRVDREFKGGPLAELKARVRELVVEHTQGRMAGLLGEPRVNVLALNLALDGASK